MEWNEVNVDEINQDTLQERYEVIKMEYTSIRITKDTLERVKALQNDESNLDQVLNNILDKLLELEMNANEIKEPVKGPVKEVVNGATFVHIRETKEPIKVKTEEDIDFDGVLSDYFIENAQFDNPGRYNHAQLCAKAEQLREIKNKR